MNSKKALLFINGVAPKILPKTDGFQVIACTDGAFQYLKDKNFALNKLDFISGDFDSHPGEDQQVYAEKFVYTPDQDKTDFEKALVILVENGVNQVEVYGASGGEMDHFLGNLTVALAFKENLDIKFMDEFSAYFFLPKKYELINAKGKMISLYPFSKAEKVYSKGLHWTLDGVDLEMNSKIGTRNYADEDLVKINFTSGELLIFISHKPYPGV